MGQELSVCNGGAWGRLASGLLKTLREKSPLGRAHVGISRRWRKETRPAYGPWPMHPWGLLNQRERDEENLRVSASANVNKMTRIFSACRCSSKPRGAGFEVWLMVCWVEATPSTKGFGVVFCALGPLCCRRQQSVNKVLRVKCCVRKREKWQKTKKTYCGEQYICRKVWVCTGLK